MKMTPKCARTCRFGLLAFKNIYFDTKIEILRHLEKKIELKLVRATYIRHLGGHLGLQKSQASKNFPPSLNFIYIMYFIEKSQKMILTEHCKVPLKNGVLPPDYK